MQILKQVWSIAFWATSVFLTPSLMLDCACISPRPCSRSWWRNISMCQAHKPQNCVTKTHQRSQGIELVSCQRIVLLGQQPPVTSHKATAERAEETTTSWANNSPISLQLHCQWDYFCTVFISSWNQTLAIIRNNLCSVERKLLSSAFRRLSRGCSIGMSTPSILHNMVQQVKFAVSANIPPNGNRGSWTNCQHLNAYWAILIILCILIVTDHIGCWLWAWQSAIPTANWKHCLKCAELTPKVQLKNYQNKAVNSIWNALSPILWTVVSLTLVALQLDNKEFATCTMLWKLFQQKGEEGLSPSEGP